MIPPNSRKVVSMSCAALASTIAAFGVSLAIAHMDGLADCLNGIAILIMGIAVFVMWWFAFSASIQALIATIRLWNTCTIKLQLFGIAQFFVVVPPILLTCYAMFALGSPRQKPAYGNACIANLKLIEGAKGAWALEHHKSGDDTPTEADLYGGEHAYLQQRLRCPAGGTYTFGKVEEKPLCSLREQPWHKLP